MELFRNIGNINMNTENFKDKIETKKGTYGENIVKKIFMDYGLICYAPQNEEAHPFDLILIDRNYLRFFFADIKTKPSRYVRKDTGINYRHYIEYKNFADKHGIDFYLVFVDENEKRIYGNTFKRLEKTRPLIQDGFIYWKLEDMLKICELTDKQVEDLKSFKS